MSDELAPRRIIQNVEGLDDGAFEVYLEVEIDGQEYGLLIPIDLPVDLVRVGEDNGQHTLEPVDESEYSPLMKELNSALRQWNIKTEERTHGLFLVGEPNDEFLDDCDIIEVNAEDGDEREFAVVSELDTGDSTYLVITPVVPELHPVQFTSEDSARILNDNELEDMEATFQAAIRSFEE